MNPELKEVMQGIAFYGGSIMFIVCLFVLLVSLVLANYWRDDENARKSIVSVFCLAFGLVAVAALLTGYKPW
ncbi:MAG: hypothetical protein KBD47_00090 [Candidatus Pacebacteria bacterium]|nr:hypothetical protein [Candidatus Paceibacterota bacterium]